MINLTSIDDIDIFIKKEESFLIYFSAKNCGICTTVWPKIASLFEGKFSKIKIFKVDTQKYQDINTQYGIFTNPSIIIFINGKEVLRQARIINLKDIETKISRIYKYI